MNNKVGVFFGFVFSAQPLSKAELLFTFLGKMHPAGDVLQFIM